jgi:hypothetical protein
MCWCSVLQEVKGAAWSAIASCAARPEAAALAWERLLQETVLAAPGTEAALTVAIPSYDMTYQLNEIEVGGLAAVLLEGRLARFITG